MEIVALNQLDMFILSIIVVSAIISLFRGFIKEAFSLILWISAFFLTLVFPPFAQTFGSLRGVLIVSLLFIVADDYVEQSTFAENSKIYPIIKTYNPILISKISSMIEDTNSGMLTSEQPILGNT